jgi:hypothetical protein
MNLTVRYLALLAVAVSMAGCADTPLLSGKKAPDELSVIEGPPLYLPPSFDLRPPSELAAQAPNTDPENKAQELISGTPAVKTVPAEASNDWLVKRAGGDSRDASIRARLDAEEKARQEVKKEKEDQGFFSRLFDRDKGDEDAKVDEAGRVILDKNAPDADNYQKQ